VQISDFVTFLKAYEAKNTADNTPVVLYGYSLGGTMCLGTYFALQGRLAERVKAVVLVCPQLGMGDYWYPCWYRPRYGRLLGQLNYRWGTFPPLVGMRDRHCEIQYKGPVYGRTLWNVHSWTDRH